MILRTISTQALDFEIAYLGVPVYQDVDHATELDTENGSIEVKREARA